MERARRARAVDGEHESGAGTLHASATYDVEAGEQLLTLYEAGDACIGRLFDVAYAEAFKSHSPLLVASPTVFLPGLHG